MVSRAPRSRSKMREFEKSEMIQEDKNIMDRKGRPAKIRISAKIFCRENHIPATVFVHLKGRLRARVTHLDIESRELQKCAPKLCKNKSKHWPNISPIPGGFVLSTTPKLKVKSKVLEEFMPEESLQAMVGGKGARGIFIGLPKQIKDALRCAFDPRITEDPATESNGG